MNYICLKTYGQAGTISSGIRATARPYNHLMRATARTYIFQSIYICLKTHGQAGTISFGIRATARPYNHFIHATTCPSNHFIRATTYPSNHFIRAAARPYIKPSISLNIEKMKTTPIGGAAYCFHNGIILIVNCSFFVSQSYALLFGYPRK